MFNRNKGIRAILSPRLSREEIAEDTAAKAYVMRRVGPVSEYKPLDPSIYRVNATLDKLQAAPKPVKDKFGNTAARAVKRKKTDFEIGMEEAHAGGFVKGAKYIPKKDPPVTGADWKNETPRYRKHLADTIAANQQTIFYNKTTGKWMDKWDDERKPQEVVKEQQEIQKNYDSIFPPQQRKQYQDSLIKPVQRKRNEFIKQNKTIKQLEALRDFGQNRLIDKKA